MIQLHDKKFEVFISGEEINFAIENMAKQIEDDFCDVEKRKGNCCCNRHTEKFKIGIVKEIQVQRHRSYS